jgi:DNA-binding HxlR family transcriptional regulator
MRQERRPPSGTTRRREKSPPRPVRRGSMKLAGIRTGQRDRRKPARSSVRKRSGNGMAEVALLLRDPSSTRDFFVRERVAVTADRSTARASATGIARRASRSTDRVARRFDALGHPIRLRMLGRLLIRSSTHRELSRVTGFAAGPLYHHLRLLERTGLIEVPKRNEYRLTPLGRKIALFLPALEKLVSATGR